MAILNVHTRRVDAPVLEAAALLDRLASDADRFWPGKTWPPMRFDRPLDVGAAGGHGPIRYTVSDYEPGRWIRFAFTGPSGFHGFHEFTVRADGASGTLITHLLVLRPRGRARLSFPLLYRPLHDALLENALDRAELALSASASTDTSWSRYVQMLRWFLARTTRGRARRDVPCADVRANGGHRTSTHT